MVVCLKSGPFSLTVFTIIRRLVILTRGHKHIIGNVICVTPEKKIHTFFFFFYLKDSYFYAEAVSPQHNLLSKKTEREGEREIPEKENTGNLDDDS